jgi:ATP-dependent DNA helicase RecQ
MSSIGVSLDELTAGCPRLARRLARGVVAAADVAVLVRSELVARNYASLAVAGTPLERWDAKVWKASGLASEGSVVRPLAWHPDWLDHNGTTAPDEAPSRRTARRRDGSLPADLFYQQAMRRSTAKTVGQRDALRATALAGPGDTVTCVLPTGTGKTDVVLARVLRNRPRQSLIVVPTIALAVDLERRVQSLLPGTDERFAYFGSGDPSDKEGIRLGVADGSQWLTIASPEAACTGLASPLMDAALRGTLDLIVVDEAHIVAEWGDAFRPAFQAFAGLRQRLLETAPTERQAATVLLTGTLDSYGLATLTRLFPGRNRLLVSGQTTRPEPAWWFARCSDEDDKRNKLIEALRHMPRPALVYTTLHRSQRSTNTGTVRGWLTDAG